MKERIEKPFKTLSHGRLVLQLLKVTVIEINSFRINFNYKEHLLKSSSTGFPDCQSEKALFYQMLKDTLKH